MSNNDIRPEDVRRIAAAKERQVLGEEGLRRFLQPGASVKNDVEPYDREPAQREPQLRAPQTRQAAPRQPMAAASAPRGPYDDELRREPAYPDDASGDEQPEDYDMRFSPDDFAEYAGPSRGRWRKYLPAGAALVVLIGFGLVGLYAFDWGSETDVASNGDVPVIAADPEPVKIKPEEAGGEAVDNQDVTVLNPDADGDEPEVLMPPPEVPQPPPAPATVTITEPVETETTEEATTGTTEGATTLEPPPPPATVEAQPALVAAPEPPPAPEPVVVEATPVPEPVAPEPIVEAAAPATDPAPAASATSGAFLIQLASIKSSDGATSEWNRLQKEFPDLLGDMALNVQQATVNGTEYFRVQAGPLPNRATADDMCAELKAKSQDCIVVKR